MVKIIMVNPPTDHIWWAEVEHTCFTKVVYDVLTREAQYHREYRGHISSIGEKKTAEYPVMEQGSIK